MPAYICKTCGVQAAESEAPPGRCPICEDERQYVGDNGQEWVLPDDLALDGRRNEFQEEEENLIGIRTRPQFGIGQRALLVRTGAGNVLWDCISYLDDDTVAQVRALGGVQAIAISHPHFYGAMIDWAQAFDCPIYLHGADAEWVQRPGTPITLWHGVSHEIRPGLVLLNPGGHFEGAAVLHWQSGAEGRGALLSSDTVTVVRDRRFVSFMYSYPNLIPLGAAAIERIVATLRPYTYERIYGAVANSVIRSGGARSVERSAERYLRRIGG